MVRIKSVNISRYIIDASYDDWATFENINNVTVNSSVYNVPTDKTKTKVQFRSRAQDKNNIYYDYVYSDIYIIQHNVIPTLILNTIDNQILYHNDNFIIEGTTLDTDIDNILTIKYQINDYSEQILKSDTSDGINSISFSKTLIFKDNKLFYN